MLEYPFRLIALMFLFAVVVPTFGFQRLKQNSTMTEYFAILLVTLPFLIILLFYIRRIKNKRRLEAEAVKVMEEAKIKAAEKTEKDAAAVKAIKAMEEAQIKAAEKAAAKAAEKEKKRLLEESKKEDQLLQIQNPSKKPNIRTKTKFAENGYITNPKWDAREKAQLIRAYGVHRFMFPQQIRIQENLHPSFQGMLRKLIFREQYHG